MICGARLFALEARRSLAIWIVPLVAGITWFMGREPHAAEVTLWTKTSAQVGQAIVLLGPLCGAVTARIASRDRRRGTEELLATTPMSPVARDLLGLATTIAWALFAYLAVVAVVFGMAWHDATWGSPNFVPLTLGVATLLFCGAAGYAAGLYVPSRFTPAVTSTALFVALILPTSGSERWVADGPRSFVDFESPVRALTPVTYVDPADYDPFFTAWPHVALPMTTWLLGITVAAVAIIVLYRQRDVRAWGMLLVAILSASIAATALSGSIERQDLSLSADGPQPICREARVSVCLHPAYAAILDEASKLVNALTAPVAGLPGVPSRIEQSQWSVPAEYRPEPSPGTLQAHFYNWIFNGEGGRAADAEAIVRSIVCNSHCEYGEQGYRFGDPARTVVGVWLLEQAGVDPAPSPPGNRRESEQHEVEQAAERFAALDSDTRRLWLELHFADLRAGRLTLANLP